MIFKLFAGKLYNFCSSQCGQGLILKLISNKEISKKVASKAETKDGVADAFSFRGGQILIFETLGSFSHRFVNLFANNLRRRCVFFVWTPVKLAHKPSSNANGFVRPGRVDGIQSDRDQSNRLVSVQREQTTSNPPFFLRDSRASKTRARVKINPREKRRHAAGERKMSPFLLWVDFHARSRFARSTIPEEKWGTTRSLNESVLSLQCAHTYFNLTE